MGFINNTKDAFLPTSHPWDDTSTTYSMPTQKSPKRKLQELSYEDLKSMLDEMTYQHDRISSTEIGDEMRVSLEDKMRAVIHELKERDDLEEATYEERNDSFEEPLPQFYEYEEDIQPEPISPPFMDADDMDMGDDDLDMFEPNEANEIVRPVIVEQEEEEEDYEDELLEDEAPPQNDTTNFLLGALIVIVLIAITKK